MPGFLEIATRGGRAVLETGVLKISGEVQPHISSMTMLGGLYAMFPDRIGEVGVRQQLIKTNRLQELLVTLNDEVDFLTLGEKIGTNIGFVPAYQLTNYLHGEVERRKIEFLRLYPEHPSYKTIIENAINDARLLSEKRTEFLDPQTYEDPTPQDFLDIDSAIHVVCVAGVIDPKILKEAGIDFENPATTSGMLMEKYRLFLVGRHADATIAELNPVARGLLGLFATQMPLKIGDDRRDGGVDDLLGIPNFRNSCLNNDECKRRYIEVAQRCGMSESIARFIETTFLILRKIKIDRCLKNEIPTDDPWDLIKFYGNGYTSTLRDRLERVGLLDRLLIDWPRNGSRTK